MICITKIIEKYEHSDAFISQVLYIYELSNTKVYKCIVSIHIWIKQK